jgi:hypothetical protein
MTIPNHYIYMVYHLGKWMVAAMILIPVFLSGCHRSEQPTTVVLTLYNTQPHEVILLEQDPYLVNRVDSMMVEPGIPVEFHLNIRETGIYAIRVGSAEKIVFIANPGDKLGISADMTNFEQSIEVTGSTQTKRLQDFYRYAAHNKAKVDSLQKIVEESQYDPDFFHITLQLDSCFNRIWEDQRAYEIGFINQNPGSLASLLVLHYHFGVKPVLSAVEDSSIYKMVDSALMQSMPENKHTLFFHQLNKEVR